MGEPARQLVDNALRIWPRIHADIIALEGADERLRHAIRLRTADWGRARDQPNAPGEGACVASGVAAAVVGKPLDRFRHPVHLSVAMFDRGDHQVLDVLCGDAARCRHVSHRLAVAAVERERDTHLLAIVTCDLQPVGAPAGVAQIDGDPAIVTPFLAASSREGRRKRRRRAISAALLLGPGLRRGSAFCLARSAIAPSALGASRTNAPTARA